jgi:hypothetical protein
MHTHLAALGLPRTPLSWAPDAAAGFGRAHKAPESRKWVSRVSDLDDLRHQTSRPAMRALTFATAWTEIDGRVLQLVERKASAVVPGHPRIRWGPARTAASCLATAVDLASLVASDPDASATPGLHYQLEVWLPFIEAYDAGLWLFWPLEHEIILVERPTFDTEGGRLHCADGPAIRWPAGAGYFFWRGVEVPADVILFPEAIRAGDVLREQNTELRRILLERMGPARFLRETGARPVHADECGRLYRIAAPGVEPIAFVEVTNSTPEPDGTYKRYLLRVPPVRTARAAVAWTFGMSERQYAPAAQT